MFLQGATLGEQVESRRCNPHQLCLMRLSPCEAQRFSAPKSGLWRSLETSLSLSDPQAILKMGLEPWSSFWSCVLALLKPLSIVLPNRFIIRKGHGINGYHAIFVCKIGSPQNLAEGNPSPSLNFLLSPFIIQFCAAVMNEKWIQFKVKLFFL